MGRQFNSLLEEHIVPNRNINLISNADIKSLMEKYFNIVTPVEASIIRLKLPELFQSINTISIIPSNVTSSTTVVNIPSADLGSNANSNTSATSISSATSTTQVSTSITFNINTTSNVTSSTAEPSLSNVTSSTAEPSLSNVTSATAEQSLSNVTSSTAEPSLSTLFFQYNDTWENCALNVILFIRTRYNAAWNSTSENITFNTFSEFVTNLIQSNSLIENANLNYINTDELDDLHEHKEGTTTDTLKTHVEEAIKRITPEGRLQNEIDTNVLVNSKEDILLCLTIRAFLQQDLKFDAPKHLPSDIDMSNFPSLLPLCEYNFPNKSLMNIIGYSIIFLTENEFIEPIFKLYYLHFEVIIVISKDKEIWTYFRFEPLDSKILNDYDTNITRNENVWLQYLKNIRNPTIYKTPAGKVATPAELEQNKIFLQTSFQRDVNEPKGGDCGPFAIIGVCLLIIWRYPQSFRDNYLPPLTCRQFRVQIGDWILTHQFENLAGITPTETEIFQFELQEMLNLYLPYNSETMTHDVWLQQVIPRFKQSEEDVRSGAVWLNTSFLMKSLQAILYNGFVDNAERFWFSTVDAENFLENYRATGLVRTHLMGMSILIVGDFELSEMTIRNLTSHYDALIVFTNKNHFVAWFSKIPLRNNPSIYTNMPAFLYRIARARKGLSYG